MSERNSVYVFKGPTVDEFRDTMAIVVASLDGKLDSGRTPCADRSESPATSHNANVHAAYIDYRGDSVATGIGTALKIPWINVRIQEGSLWDYSLVRSRFTPR